MLRVCLFTNIVLAAADCAPGGECIPSASGTQLLQRTQTLERHLSEPLTMEEMPNGEKPMEEMPLEKMLASDPTSKGSWEQVTCPVMGALLKGGDLIPDENGHVNKIQVRDAMLRVGTNKSIVAETTDGNFDHLPEPKNIELFNMDLGMASNKSQKLRNKEHDFSTGVRDGAAPNSSAYTVFEGFIGTDGDDQTWSQRDVLTAIEYYKQPGVSNDKGSAEGAINSLSAMLFVFGNSDGKLSKSEMEQLFMSSEYPGEFKARRAQAVEDWEAAVSIVSGGGIMSAN